MDPKYHGKTQTPAEKRFRPASTTSSSSFSVSDGVTKHQTYGRGQAKSCDEEEKVEMGRSQVEEVPVKCHSTSLQCNL